MLTVRRQPDGVSGRYHEALGAGDHRDQSLGAAKQLPLGMAMHGRFTHRVTALANGEDLTRSKPGDQFRSDKRRGHPIGLRRGRWVNEDVDAVSSIEAWHKCRIGRLRYGSQANGRSLE